jgi:hypothetical protein
MDQTYLDMSLTHKTHRNTYRNKKETNFGFICAIIQ